MLGGAAEDKIMHANLDQVGSQALDLLRRSSTEGDRIKDARSSLKIRWQEVRPLLLHVREAFDNGGVTINGATSWTEWVGYTEYFTSTGTTSTSVNWLGGQLGCSNLRQRVFWRTLQRRRDGLAVC
jgi:hypothetical protein